jgi:alkanesulfonate monooxygenase SsuD/methylene tetrahydromethanopterin reductase-like flavin-dependent oxidoreductase (luciferase family)
MRVDRHRGVEMSRALELLRGKGFAQPNPRPMFPNPPGLLRLEPYSEGLRDRIWWGAGSNATAVWAWSPASRVIDTHPLS